MNSPGRRLAATPTYAEIKGPGRTYSTFAGPTALPQRVPFKADRIEDSAIKPGGLPEGAGGFWRARQFDPHEGRTVRMLPLGKGKRRGSVMLVREFGA